MAGTESPIDFRADGSIKFDIDDVTIRWRPPKAKHVRVFRNRYYAMTVRSKERLDELTKAITDGDAGDEAAQGMTEQLETDVVDWVRDLHEAIQLEGSLPDDDGEWPGWLVRLRFVTAVMNHWGSAPFA